MSDFCQLYLITPPRLDDLEGFAILLTQTLDAGSVACVQLRLKEAEDDAIRRACDVLRPLAQERDIAFLLNDRPDLAAELDCDGVHVGQEDMPYKQARALVGPDRIVGVTCHNSRHLAMEAAEQGADYVAFGAFFPTATKDPKTTAEVDLLSWWQELMEVPCVAIGGITVHNASTLIEAGADFIAVCGGIWDYPDGPVAAMEAFGKIMEA